MAVLRLDINTRGGLAVWIWRLEYWRYSMIGQGVIVERFRVHLSRHLG